MSTKLSKSEEANDKIRPSFVRGASSVGESSTGDRDPNDEAFLTALAKKFSRKPASAAAGTKKEAVGAIGSLSDTEDQGESLSSYARMALRVRKALTPRRVKRMSRASSGSSVLGSSSSTGIGEGVPATQVRAEAFSRNLTAEEISDDYATMRNKFPRVPKFDGNPPWITTYRPELVGLPPRK